jgi:hypothetical protein
MISYSLSHKGERVGVRRKRVDAPKRPRVKSAPTVSVFKIGTSMARSPTVPTTTAAGDDPPLARRR